MLICYWAETNMPGALNQCEGCSSAYRVSSRQKIYAWIRQIPTSNRMYRVWILRRMRKDVGELKIAALV